jgi:hypothetical protein
MTKRQAVEALDTSMRDIMDRPYIPFGGGKQSYLEAILDRCSPLSERYKSPDSRCFTKQVGALELHEAAEA